MQTTSAEEAPSVLVVTAPKKSLKEKLLEARKDARAKINAMRLNILAQLDELAELGGTDVYEDAVMAFVNEAGTEGITIAKIHTVLPDSVALTKARNALVTKGKIKAEKDGVTFKLTLIEGTAVKA